MRRNDADPGEIPRRRSFTRAPAWIRPEPAVKASQARTDIQGLEAARNHLWVYICGVAIFILLLGGPLLKNLSSDGIYLSATASLFCTGHGSVISEWSRKTTE